MRRVITPLPRRRRGGGISSPLCGGGGLKSSRRVTIAIAKHGTQEATSLPLQTLPKTTSLSFKIFISALLLRNRLGVGDCVLRGVPDEAEGMDRIQGIAEEELGGWPRVGRIERALKGLVESGVLSAEKRGRRSERVSLMIGEEEDKVVLREDPDVGDVVGG